MNFDKEQNDKKVTRISVDYSHGNYGGRRGIFVRFDDLELIHHGDFVIERGCPFDGMSVFCEQMARANAKTLKKWVDAVDAIKEKLFEYWERGQRDAICCELANI